VRQGPTGPTSDAAAQESKTVWDEERSLENDDEIIKRHAAKRKWRISKRR